MDGQGQLELLLELYDLEKVIGKKRGKGKKELQDRIDRICSRIDSWVLKHFRRHEMPFGEFRDRTCSACGMIYPQTHVHCRPDTGTLRLCEGCGRILVDAEDGHDTGEDLSTSDTAATGVQKPKKASAKKAAATHAGKTAGKTVREKTAAKAKKKTAKRTKKKPKAG